MNDSQTTHATELQVFNQQPVAGWLDTMSQQELIEAAEYLKADADCLRKAAAKYAETPGHQWIAEKVAANADYSEGLAQAALVKAKGLEA